MEKLLENDHKILPRHSFPAIGLTHQKDAAKMSPPEKRVNGVFSAVFGMKLGVFIFLLGVGAFLGFLWCLLLVKTTAIVEIDPPVALVVDTPLDNDYVLPGAKLDVGLWSGQPAPTVFVPQKTPYGDDVLIVPVPLPQGGFQLFILQCKVDTAKGRPWAEPALSLSQRVDVETGEHIDFSGEHDEPGDPRLKQSVYWLKPRGNTPIVVAGDDFVNMPAYARASFMGFSDERAPAAQTATPAP